MSIDKLEIQRFPDKSETIVAVGLGLVDVVRTRNFRSPEAGLYALNGLGFGAGKLLGQPDGDHPPLGATEKCNDENCDQICDAIETQLSAQSTDVEGHEAKAIPWTLIIQLAMYVLDKFLKR